MPPGRRTGFAAGPAPNLSPVRQDACGPVPGVPLVHVRRRSGHRPGAGRRPAAPGFPPAPAAAGHVLALRQAPPAPVPASAPATQLQDCVQPAGRLRLRARFPSVVAEAHSPAASRPAHACVHPARARHPRATSSRTRPDRSAIRHAAGRAEPAGHRCAAAGLRGPLRRCAVRPAIAPVGGPPDRRSSPSPDEPWRPVARSSCGGPARPGFPATSPTPVPDPGERRPVLRGPPTPAQACGIPAATGRPVPGASPAPRPPAAGSARYARPARTAPSPAPARSRPAPPVRGVFPAATGGFPTHPAPGRR
ncbi:hypothetical protein D3C78_737490 [compost metagenome]